MKISGVEDQLGRVMVQGFPPSPPQAQRTDEESFGTILKQVESAVGAPSNQQEGSPAIPHVDEERATLLPLWQAQAPNSIERVSSLQQPGVAKPSLASTSPPSQGSAPSPPRTLIDLFRGLIAAFRQARAQGKNFFAAVFDTIKYLLSLMKLSGPPAATTPPQRINERV